eukprot:7793974-Alexandrium_andersonii.AAC.1
MCIRDSARAAHVHSPLSAFGPQMDLHQGCPCNARGNLRCNLQRCALQLESASWDLHSPMCPKCSQQSAQCSSVLRPAPSRNPPRAQ